jgi:lipopolysaccharide transport system ATP-binding protein
MSDIVIQAENLSKRYRIGERQGYLTLRDVLARAISTPARIFKARKPAPRYGHPSHFWALKDVSLAVRQGEVVGIIGGNGAGKTTLLKILARVTRPTEGRAQVKGRVGSLLEVGTGFHPELTGRENVYLSGAILGMRKKEIERKFDEIVAFAEVEKFLDTPLKHYSSGMQMRLAFAVAAHLEPEILLVDEVLAVGDAAFQKKCMGKMGDVAKEGRTVIFVSHNMTAIRSLCVRGHLISQGRTAFSGPIDQCIERYLLSASKDMPAEVLTENMPRPGKERHDTTLRITKVRVESGTTQAVVASGAPLTLSMEFQVRRLIANALFGLSVYSGDGVRVFESRSVASYGTIGEIAPGRYSVLCMLKENPLNPGIYRLEVGARCEAKLLDWLPDVMTFRVVSSERLGSLWLEGTAGLVRQASEWALPVILAPITT